MLLIKMFFHTSKTNILKVVCFYYFLLAKVFRRSFQKRYNRALLWSLVITFFIACTQHEPKVFQQKNKLKTIKVLLSDQDLSKIITKREEALKLGALMTSKKDLVDGLIVFEGDTLQAKIRLKGDQTDHLITEKWSLRVILKNYSDKLKMKTFSLQHPACSGYLYDWSFYHLVRFQGLIGLQLDFVNVNFNGVNKGVYAIEQHFDQSILTYNNRPKGPILKIDEDEYWEIRKGNTAESDELKQLSYDVYKTGKVKIFYKKEIIPDIAKQAKKTLKEYRERKIAVDEAFDIVALAKFYALCEIYGTEHALVWRNRRFYYNPNTQKLEPVTYDANKVKPHMDNDLYVQGNDELITEITQQLMSNDAFNKYYFNFLKKYSETTFLDSFFTEIAPALDSALTVLKTEYPNYIFPKTEIYQEQSKVKRTLEFNNSKKMSL